MFKRDWLAIGVYRNPQGKLEAVEMNVDNSTKKQAINEMYNLLCWDQKGLKIGFRDVEIVTARKAE